MRSSWLASATKRRTFCSLCSRADERGCHVAEHAVERRAEPAHLGAVVVDGHALAERDVAAVERQFGHALRGGGDLGQRAERAPHHGRADDEREHQADDRDDRDR